MAAPKLSPQDRDKILIMLAAREDYPTIANAVGCSPGNIDYYAKQYRERIAELRTAHDARAMGRGLRTREKRIEALETLAKRLAGELEDSTVEGARPGNGLWKKNVKLSSTGKEVWVDEFATPIVQQYRGVLEDLAKEMGDRATKQEVTLQISKPLADMTDDELKELLASANRNQEQEQEPDKS